MHQSFKREREFTYYNEYLDQKNSISKANDQVINLMQSNMDYSEL